MNTSDVFRAGAGRAVVAADGCLPLEGFTRVHDPLHVRALILESGCKLVIVSVEITSLFEETQARMMEIIRGLTGVPETNIWLTLTHSFAGPHLWPSPSPGEEDRPQPGHKVRSAEEIARCDQLRDAYFTALTEALKKAEASLTPAVLGSGRGACGINASRNLRTPEGWWLGTDDGEPCDHSLNVLRVDSAEGAPIAAMFVYGIRSCVMNRVKGGDGGGLISSDLCGNASTYLEEQLGGGFTALFLCGAAGDQEPRLKGRYETLDAAGNLKQVDMSAAAPALLKAQGVRLGDEVLKVWRSIAPRETPPIRIASRDVLCRTKKMDRNRGAHRPVRACDFVPEGEKTLTAYGARLGGFYLLGVQPELDGATTLEIAEALPEDNVAVAIMVNGADKCMPEAEAYAQVKYQCQNSPFMPGAAEVLRDAAVQVLKSLKRDN